MKCCHCFQLSLTPSLLGSFTILNAAPVKLPHSIGHRKCGLLKTLAHRYVRCGASVKASLVGMHAAAQACPAGTPVQIDKTWQLALRHKPVPNMYCAQLFRWINHRKG